MLKMDSHLMGILENLVKDNNLMDAHLIFKQGYRVALVYVSLAKQI